MHTATKGSKINISSEKKLGEFANNLSSKLKQGDIFFLYGEMGVGKTTFIRYLINEFQESKNLDITEVPSPTFNLLNEYKIGTIILKHCDLYRIKDEKELDSIGIFENYSQQIILIEWPEKIKNTKLKNIINLYFEYDKNYKNRYLTISSNNKINFLDEFK